MHPRFFALAICLSVGTARCGGSSNGGASTGPGASADGGSPPDGGVATNECDGLAADPNATFISISPPAESCGLAAISDSSGNVALSGSSDMATSKNWATYDRAGARIGTLHALGPVFARKSGFFGIDYSKNGNPQADYLDLWTFAPDGSGAYQSVGVFLCRANLQPTSAAGVLVLGNCGAGIRSASRVIWFDDTGAQKWTTFPGAGSSGAAAGDSAGNVLVTADGDVVQGGPKQGDLVGRWIAADGSLSGDWFVLVSGNTTSTVLQPTIGGGIAVMQNGKWIAVVPSLGAPASPPDWLTSRPDRDFRAIRGGKAYAFTSRIVPPAGSGGASVEVVTPSGKSCGTFDTKGTAATVGADGTVIANADACSRRVWPALLGAR
jgi:hypothetical protein